MAGLMPPCTYSCPVQTDVRGYVAAIARRDYLEAYRLIRANNPFPSVCAWICPHPCEDACRRACVDAPLSVRDLKRFAVEASGGLREDFASNGDSGRKVAVVGAGPAGLTAAYDLARSGHRVAVYDRLPEPGGQFLASLPVYRLPRKALRKDVEEILAAGVEFRPGVEVGRDITVGRLRDEYDAVIISAGLWKGRGLNLPGFEGAGVYSALPFLKTANMAEGPAQLSRVIVIGGGDVAMDVARTALRLGAGEVSLACLESREDMPAHSWEIEEALAEGVVIIPGYGPVELLRGGGSISGVRFQRVISVFDQEGRFSPIFKPGSFLTVPGDTVVLAIGQDPDNIFLEGSGLAVDVRGRLAVNREDLTTSVKGVFACGEVAGGPGPAIAAIASGHRAARLVNDYLKGYCLVPAAGPEEVVGSLPVEVAEKVPRRERADMPALAPEERKKSLAAYELGLGEEAALGEAARCLSCGLGARVNPGKCAACLNCQRVCPYGVPQVEGSANMPAEGCQACGICASACPALAITIGALDEGEILRSLESLEEGREAVVFACRGVRAHINGTNGLIDIPGFEKARIIELTTGGALRLEWILKAFEKGATGVAVLVCGSDSCQCAGGTAPLDGLIARARNILNDIGLPPERFQFIKR